MWKYKLIIMVLRNVRKVKIIIKVHFPSQSWALARIFMINQQFCDFCEISACSVVADLLQLSRCL